MASLRCGLLAAMICATVSASYAADSVKLRPMAPLYVDAKGAGLNAPEGVGCDSTGLLVADTGNGRIVRYLIEEDTIAAAGELILAQVPHPIRVESDSKGRILALDGKSRRIVRISATGEFEGYVEPVGLKGEFVPRSFKIDEADRLYLLDIFSARVLVLDATGRVLREIAFPDEYGFFSDIAVHDGTVFAVDSVGKQVFSADGDAAGLTALSESLKEDLDFPTGIAADSQGRLYVVDQNGGGIVILGRDGSFGGRQSNLGWLEGYLRYPSELCIDDRGNMFVADRGNNRVQPFLIVQ